MTLIALTVCLALLLLPNGKAALRRLQPVRVSTTSRNVKLLVCFVLVSALGMVAMWLGLRALGWAVVSAICLGTVGGLGLLGRARKRRVALARQVARAARVLAGQLRLGQVPATALADAARDNPVLARAAAAAGCGASVPDALRGSAGVPGQGGLATLAAAWELSAHTGAPIAAVLVQVADALVEEEAMAAAVAVEIAPARATGRILAVLPLAGLGLGFVAGGNPIEFFATHWAGELLVVVGVSLCAAGLWWLEQMAAKVEVAQ